MSDELELMLPRSSPRLARQSLVGPGLQRRTPARIPKKRLPQAEKLNFRQKPVGEVVQKSRQRARINRALLVKHLGVFNKNYTRRKKNVLAQLELVRKAARKRSEKTVRASKRRVQKSREYSNVLCSSKVVM